MAYERINTGRWAWLKSVGSSGEPLERDWRIDNAHLLSKCWFSKHPRSPQAGDLFVYYAARWGRLCALMELVSDEVMDEDVKAEHPVNAGRWRYAMHVRPLVLLDLPTAPTLAEAGIDPLRVRRQSHIKLTAEEFTPIRSLLLNQVTIDVDSEAQRAANEPRDLVGPS